MSSPGEARGAPNIYEPRFDDVSDRPGFSYRDAWIAQQAGAERLGASLYELEPGEANFPYHWHAGNEEMLLVLSGSVVLREPGGERGLEAGALVAFPRGERGAHQLINRGSAAARFLMLSEMRGPDICVYPDSKKIGVREAPPGSGEDGVRLNFLEPDAVDYWRDETPPESA
jgi:uncharacterized cupin superfamily protein